MTQQSSDIDSKETFKWWHITLVPCVIILLWIGSFVVVWTYFGKLDEAGQFGDMFGAVNALFSGLALAGVIFAILLQRKELELQRQELIETRKELKRSADAQIKSEAALSEQAAALALTAQLNILSVRPVIDVSISAYARKYSLSLKNVGRTPGFDIEVFLLAVYDDDEVSLKELVRKNNAELRKGDGPFSKPKIQLKDVEVDETGEYRLYERIDRFFLSDGTRISASLGFPTGSFGITLLFQFRDAQGTNYNQVFEFSPPNGENGRFELLSIDPVTPCLCGRVSFGNELPDDNSLKGFQLVVEGTTKGIPEPVSRFIKLWKDSIPIGKVNIYAILGLERFIEINELSPFGPPA